MVSDEPRSALVGRDILSAGGNAVDAAVATYFAMSVTYPGAATLGGGGMCVVSRGQDDAVEAIDFRPALFAQGGRAVMIPGAVRGMFALHARYGRLKWEALLLPAERLARFGNPVPRAFARQIAGLPAAAFAGPEFRRIFTVEGKPLARARDSVSRSCRRHLPVSVFVARASFMRATLLQPSRRSLGIWRA